MKDDLTPGNPSPKRRMVLGVRLTLMFLAAVRFTVILPAAALLVGCVVQVLTACFDVESPRASPWASILRLMITLLAAELLIAVAVGSKWLDDLIRARHEYPAGGGPDPVDSAGYKVMVMIEIVLLLSGFACFLWIIMEISSMGNTGPAWPAFWALFGGLAWWARRELLRRLARRAVSRDTDPCSTPGIPPSSGP